MFNSPCRKGYSTPKIINHQSIKRLSHCFLRPSLCSLSLFLYLACARGHTNTHTHTHIHTFNSRVGSFLALPVTGLAAQANWLIQCAARATHNAVLCDYRCWSGQLFGGSSPPPPYNRKLRHLRMAQLLPLQSGPAVQTYVLQLWDLVDAMKNVSSLLKNIILSVTLCCRLISWRLFSSLLDIVPKACEF